MKSCLAPTLAVMACLTSGLTADKPTRLDVTAFGGKPDPGEDAGPAVRAVLAKASKIEGPVIIRFPKGRYDFFKASAETVHLPVTAVHQQWDHVTPIFLDRQRDLEIDGDGSLFVMHGRMTPLIVNRCERVRLANLAIDQEFPCVREALVETVTPGVVEFRIHPDTRNQQGAILLESRDLRLERVALHATNGLAIRNNLFESPRPSAHLVTVFGCGGVQLEGNRLSTRDGRATILHGQMAPGEIRVAAETGWTSRRRSRNARAGYRG